MSINFKLKFELIYVYHNVWNPLSLKWQRVIA